MWRAAEAMRECIVDSAAALASARDEFSTLRAMGEPEHHADRVMWRAPAGSDTLSEALHDVARARAARTCPCRPIRASGVMICARVA